MSAVLEKERVEACAAPHLDMIYISGGTFRMGSDGHYPEEAPATASASTDSGSTRRR